MAGTPRRRQSERQRSVFINVPFDDRYERLYIALIVGLIGLGLTPRSSLEYPPSPTRLARIFRLLRSCGASVHDLSRVQLSRSKPRVPRFNMPFEAGLATALLLGGERHERFILEAHPHRLQKTLSDLSGVDPAVHGNTIRGMLRGVEDIFRRSAEQPHHRDLRRLYAGVRHAAARIKKEYGSLYRPGAFRILVATAQKIWEDLRRLSSLRAV